MEKPKRSGLTDKYWVTDFNFSDDVRRQFYLPENVRIHDVTLREAEQTPHVVLRPEEKLRIFEALDDMGIYSVELLPLMSKEDRQLAQELVKKPRKTKVFFLCRWVEKEVDFAAETGADGIVVECPGFPWMGKLVWNLDENQMIERLTRVVKYAKKLGMFTCAMPWDDLKAPLNFLERMYKSVVYEGGADRITLADTFGDALPWTITHVIGKMREWVPGMPIDMHAHNDFGLATSIMLSAVIGGASTVHTTMNTLGERAGNASTEEVVIGLELLLGIDTGVKLDRIYPASKLVSELTKIPIPMNKPVVGDNEFTYESGMVIDMTLRALQSDIPYGTMIFAPELIGRKNFDIILGKGSGATVIKKKLEAINLSATKEQVAEIVERVKHEAMIRKWSISDDVFENIARNVLKGE